MTDSNPIHSSQIERYIERVLDDADEFNHPLVRDVLDEVQDRWYGRLTMNVYNSLSDQQKPETILPAAAAIELLRGYIHLRRRLLVMLTDKYAHSVTVDPISALLAGNYLYTAAFLSFRSVPDSPSDSCFEILTTVPKTITEAFARTYTSAESVSHDQAMIINETAGCLGEGAAAIGATLAGFTGPTRRHCERFGRGLSIVQQINHELDPDPNNAKIFPPTFDDSQFRKHAELRRGDAVQALEILSETVDVTRLRAFAEATATRED